jgi:hypothetical protein
LAAFATQIVPGWQRIAAFGDDHEALLMYHVAPRAGTTVRAATYFIVQDGKIQTDTDVAVDFGGSRVG